MKNTEHITKEQKRIAKRLKRIEKNARMSEKEKEHISKLVRNDKRKKRTKNPTLGSSKLVLADLDKMLIAKVYPGEINAPYVAGMNTQPLPTLKFKVATSLSTATNPVTTNQPLGTNEYVVIMFCPVLTALRGMGGANQFSTSTKLGGLYTYQTDSTGGSIGMFEFGDDRYGFSMVESYGSDAQGFSEHGFVWSSKLELALIAPNANVVGKAFHGRVTLGQFYEHGVWKGITVDQMIKIADSIEDIQQDHKFCLQAAVNNHDVVFSNEHHMNDIGEEYMAEYVEYLVIQKAAASISTGAKMEYSFIGEFSGNAVFWPNAFDSLANNLYRINTKVPTKQSNNRNGMLTHLADRISNTNWSSLAPAWSGVKSAVSWLSNNAGKGGYLGTALGIAKTALPFLLKPSQPLTPEDTVFIYDFVVKMEALRPPTLSVPVGAFPEYDAYLQGITFLKKWARLHSGKRCIPIKDLSKETYKERLSELSQIGMKTESEISEFRQLARAMY